MTESEESSEEEEEEEGSDDSVVEVRRRRHVPPVLEVRVDTAQLTLNTNFLFGGTHPFISTFYTWHRQKFKDFILYDMKSQNNIFGAKYKKWSCGTNEDIRAQTNKFYYFQGSSQH